MYLKTGCLLVPSLKTLNSIVSEGESVNQDVVALRAELYARTSLPQTIGLTYGLLMLTILSLTLSQGSLFSKWFFCWQYILMMTSIPLFYLTISILQPNPT